MKIKNPEMIINDPKKKHDFVILFDCLRGNPNGDPDRGNAPRQDDETGQGLVTDVCLKRKIRDYVLARSDGEGMAIYVQPGTFLVTRKREAYKANGLEKGAKPDEIARVRQWMCAQYFDIRMFGAVLVGKKGEYTGGQVKGPMQLTIGDSLHPVSASDITITRVVPESPDEVKEGEEGIATHGTMGRKAMIQYGLYCTKGFYSPFFGEKTGVKSDDLRMFWEALKNMWDLDRSSARGMMACRKVVVFSHENFFGNAPVHDLFDRVQVRLLNDPPRKYSDYEVTVDEQHLPTGVSVTIL